MLTENSTIIKEILFESEVPTFKICPTSRGLDFLKFGDYSLNRSTLDLLKNEEQFGSCIMSSVEAVKEAAKEYLASRLSKNKI